MDMRRLFNGVLVIAVLLLVGGCSSASRTSVTSAGEDNVATLNLKLGVGYMQQGRFDLALEKLKKALEYDDQLAEAHNAIAVLYEETGEISLAEEHYKRALALDPGYTLAKLNYGRFLCTQGKSAEGESQFLTIAQDPSLKSVEKAYTGAGFCARLANKLEQAEAHLRKALEQNPNGTEALYEMAMVNHAQGKNLQARAFLQRYHSQAGYTPASLLVGIEIEDALGDSELRREYARVLLTKFADSSEARRLRPQ
jgi:type IV pilus assembly protein PilF